MNPATVNDKVTPDARPHVSIILKARNEQKKITAALDAAEFAARRLAPVPVEILLADSCSTDDTVALAMGRPVKVIQFTNENDCGCGAGVELGYQAARGDFIYVMDADMCLDPEFLPKALACMEKDPQLAGVGGLVVDTQVSNTIDRIRVNNKSVTAAGFVKWLGGGGLYRRKAIETAGGYAGHPDLRAHEEAELGMRLRAAGWKLLRLNETAVLHTGHDIGGISLLLRHWKSKRAMAAGVLIRSARGTAWWREAVWICRHMLLVPLWWLMLPVASILLGSTAIWLWLVCSLAAIALYAWRKRDLGHALFSMFSWHFHFAGLCIGMLLPMGARRRPLAYRELQDFGTC